jgi:hypothetical protein
MPPTSTAAEARAEGSFHEVLLDYYLRYVTLVTTYVYIEVDSIETLAATAADTCKTVLWSIWTFGANRSRLPPERPLIS